ncbi:DYW domain [Dillenia turbinata]|uniref:DYW domain n=1 Tax=Dillenia turbinata TaxID=194707 RepID=A0AAN8VJ67_9MAGN
MGSRKQLGGVRLVWMDRERVVRHRNRFHCFKDGCCSCKDYCSVFLESSFVRCSSSNLSGDHLFSAMTTPILA